MVDAVLKILFRVLRSVVSAFELNALVYGNPLAVLGIALEFAILALQESLMRHNAHGLDLGTLVDLVVSCFGLFRLQV